MNYTTGNIPSDKQLIERVLGGDTDAFATIIKNTEGLVAQIVFRMITNPEDRKDIAQDVYLKAFNKLAGFTFQSKLSTWIGQITYHTCLNHLEKKRLLLLPVEGYSEEDDREEGLEIVISRSDNSIAGETEKIIDQKERLAILISAIENLSPLYKTLIILYHQEDLSYEEIGQITGLPAGTLKSYLFRARRTLKENLLAKYKKDEL